MPTEKKIFLAAPFHSYMDYKKGKMREDRIQQIRSLLKYFREKGYIVESAHERERWGEDWYTPEVCTPLDFKQVESSDFLIAMPGNPPSGGVHVELGWASALGKKVILLLEEGANYTNLVLGLEELTSVEFVYYKSFDEVFGKLDRISLA